FTSFPTRRSSDLLSDCQKGIGNLSTVIFRFVISFTGYQRSNWILLDSFVRQLLSFRFLSFWWGSCRFAFIRTGTCANWMDKRRVILSRLWCYTSSTWSSIYICSLFRSRYERLAGWFSRNTRSFLTCFPSYSWCITILGCFT